MFWSGRRRAASKRRVPGRRNRAHFQSGAPGQTGIEPGRIAWRAEGVLQRQPGVGVRGAVSGNRTLDQGHLKAPQPMCLLSLLGYPHPLPRAVERYQGTGALCYQGISAFDRPMRTPHFVVFLCSGDPPRPRPWRAWDAGPHAPRPPTAGKSHNSFQLPWIVTHNPFPSCC